MASTFWFPRYGSIWAHLQVSLIDTLPLATLIGSRVTTLEPPLTIFVTFRSKESTREAGRFLTPIFANMRDTSGLTLFNMTMPEGSYVVLLSLVS